MIGRPLLHCFLLASLSLTACGGSDEPADVATEETAGSTDAADADAAPADEEADAAAPAADLSGIDACTALTDEAIDQALTDQRERELTVTVERTPGTSETEELGGPQRTCEFGVSDDGGYYSWTLRIVSPAYFDEQRVFAGDSVETIPTVEGADDSFGFTYSEQVWVRRGDLAVTIENSSATQGLSLGLLSELLPTLG